MDNDIKSFGAALAQVYDHIIIADADPRHRKSGETSELVQAGVLEYGFTEPDVQVINDPIEALGHAFSIVQPGDLIVVQVDEVDQMLQRVMEYFERIVGVAEIPIAIKQSMSCADRYLIFD